MASVPGHNLPLPGRQKGKNEAGGGERGSCREVRPLQMDSRLVMATTKPLVGHEGHSLRISRPRWDRQLPTSGTPSELTSASQGSSHERHGGRHYRGRSQRGQRHFWGFRGRLVLPLPCPLIQWGCSQGRCVFGVAGGMEGGHFYAIQRENFFKFIFNYS